MSYLLGIEIGTTRVKTGIYDLEGNQLIEETCSHSVIYDKKSGSAESPVLNWWLSLKKSIHRIFSKIDPVELKAICVGSHGPTLVALDKKFNPVGNSILWMDRRGSNEAEYLSKKLGVESNDLAWFIPRAMYLKIIILNLSKKSDTLFNLLITLTANLQEISELPLSPRL